MELKVLLQHGIECGMNITLVLKRIGQTINNTLNNESRYLQAKTRTMRIYEESLDKIDEINQKNHVDLKIGRTWTGNK